MRAKIIVTICVLTIMSSGCLDTGQVTNEAMNENAKLKIDDASVNTNSGSTTINVEYSKTSDFNKGSLYLENPRGQTVDTVYTRTLRANNEAQFDLGANPEPGEYTIVAGTPGGVVTKTVNVGDQ